MRHHGSEVDAEFMGLKIQGLKGLTPDFFLGEENYGARYYEGDGSFRPDSYLVPLMDVEVEYISETRPPVDVPTEKYMDLGNEDLPAYAYGDVFRNAVRENQVTVLIGPTGSGKSTQAPQFLLRDDWDRISLTQPRRPAAANVYNRVVDELSVKLGAEKGHDLVRYQTAVRGEGPEDARIQIVTDGLQLVKELQADNDPDTKRVIIIDELHEWNVNMEILVAFLHHHLPTRPNIHVVVSSATIESSKVAEYFAEQTGVMPATVEIPGRSFDIERIERPDSTMVSVAIELSEEIYQDAEGEHPNGILMFLPGVREIEDTMHELRRRMPSHLNNIATVLPLHSKMSPEQQQDAINSYLGIKVTNSTNVAQTSLTIPDTWAVVDSGLERRTELDEHDVQGLALHEISQADCDQRAGRTGRVCNGRYILTRLDDETTFVSFAERAKFPTPEILRTDIVRTVLRVAGININMLDFKMMHPVSPDLIVRAQAELRSMGALDDKNRITELGNRMNRFPLGIYSSRMMVEVGRYSDNTRAYMAAIVASVEAGGLQHFVYNSERRWKELIEDTTSDYLAQLELFIETQTMSNQELKEKDLDIHNVERAREQFYKIARLVGAKPAMLLEPTAEEKEDLRRCIAAGLMTSLYKYEGDGEYGHLSKDDTRRVKSNRSVVAGHPQFVVGKPFRVELKGGAGEGGVKHILEGITAVTAEILGTIAVDRMVWKSEGFAMRNGKFVEVKRQTLSGIDIGSTQESVPDPSPALRDMVVEHALNNAGPSLQKLREIKKRLEQLAHRAKDPVVQFPQHFMRDLVDQATPDDATDPSLVDNNLRLIIEERGITLESFVSQERQDRILADSPDFISVNGLHLPVTYRRSQPLIKSFRKTDIGQIDEEIFLDDGRQVRFIYTADGHQKRFTLIELKGLLGL